MDTIEHIGENMAEIIDLCMTYWERHGAEFVRNAGNGVQVTYENDPDYYWFSDSPYILRHKDKWKEKDAFKEISKLSKHKTLWQEQSERDMRELLNRDEKSSYQVVVNTQNLDSHSAEVSKFLSSYGMLKVSSPMATRKSNIIEEIIKQCNAKGQRAIMITNRVSLSRDIAEKYKAYNLKHYQKNEYSRGDSLVVQFDSLFYYNPDDFDVVIIDEVTSLLMYMSENHYEGKHQRYRENIDTFMRLSNKQIAIFDAFIIDFPFKKKTLGIYNEFREKLEVVEYSDKYKFLSEITNKVKNHNWKISVSSNEKKTLHGIKKRLESNGFKVLMLTADTKDKKLIYNEFKKKKSDYDAFLYSPTLTVGVSIFTEMDCHYHYDSSGTVSVIDSIQMTRRSRNVKRMHYYIQGRSSYKSTNTQSIEAVLYSFKMVNEWGVDLGLTHAGKSVAFLRQMKNVLTNSHKYAFKALLEYQFETVLYNKATSEKFKIT